MNNYKLKLGKLFSEGWQLLLEKEKQVLVILIISNILISFIEVIALSSAMPLISLIADPTVLHNSEVIRKIQFIFGSPEINTFIPRLALVVIILIIIASSMRFFMYYAINSFSTKCWRRLSHDLLKLCTETSYSWFFSQNSAVLTRVLTQDLPRWSRDFVQLILVLIGDISILFSVIIIIITFSPSYGLLAILIFSLLALVVLSIIRPRLQYFAKLNLDHSNKVVLHTNQMLNGIKAIKVSSQEDYFVFLFDKGTSAVSHAHLMSGVWQRIAPIAMILIGQVSLVCAALLMWHFELSNAEILTSVVFAGLIASRFIPAMNSLISNIGSLWNISPFVEGIASLKNELVSKKNREIRLVNSNLIEVQKEWNTIEFKNVSYSYNNSETLALDNINVEIERGKIYGLAGPSGSGKSTFADLLLSLLKPSAGKIFVNNFDLDNINLELWRKRIAYVPQEFFILDDTLRSNIAFGIPEEDKQDERIWECLKAANLHDFIKLLENGLDTPLGDRGICLSGGQKQRVSLARALYKNPDILVLDEATSALDSISERKIQNAINSLSGKVTVLIIAHRLTTIIQADTIFLLDKGKILAKGNYDELYSENLLFKKMVIANE